MRTSSKLGFVISALVVAACGAERSTAEGALTAADAPLVHTSFPAEAVPTTPTRHPGDFYVHEISGTFRKHAAILTERVVAEEDGVWIIDYRLEDGEGARAFRVRMDEDGQITRVGRLLEGGAEQPATVAEYEAMMASASLTPDENEGLTATTRGTCLVGPAELDCETKNYRVLVGGEQASMGITETRSLPGRDVAGEITGADGKVIYRSVLIEHGNEARHDNDGVALHLPPL